MTEANRSAPTVVITGAAGALGAALAQAFAGFGANLALIDLQQSQLERTYPEANQRQLLLPVNLLDAAQVRDAAAKAVQRFQRIDVLCNIAGGFRMGSPVHETSDEDWQFLFDINVRTMLNAVRAVVPKMIEQGGGSIINVGANSAQKGVAQMGAYCAAKSVVIRLTEAMSAELREKNINVNCVLPSIIDTPANRAAMPGADTSRWVAPQALASAIVFLASDAAHAMHGVAMPVTGLS
jgi:NAD(P)-dependent dehydrogenase (short-subunit alcohol dehydrogenase family)